MNRGRGNLKQVASEQDVMLKQCQSIAQVVSSNQIAIMDAKVDKSSTLFKQKKRRSTRSCNLLIMGSFLGLALTQQKRRRRTRTRSRDMSEIPLDLLIEILCRLAGKYLAKFKCVSKQWSSLISSRYFCQRLLTITQGKQQQYLYMCLVDEDGQSALLSMSSTSPDKYNNCFVVDQDLSIPGMGGYYFNVVHGLMCFSLRNNKACTYNGSTGQRLTLPKIKADIRAEQGQNRYVNRYYIGYDPVNDQHKVLCTIAIYSDRLVNLKTEHWVFVLEAGGFWKKVVPNENYCYHAPFALGWSINGSVVHYLAWLNMYTYAIVSFDFRSEEFTTVIAPEDDRDYVFLPALERKANLIEYGGKITIFEHSYLKTRGMAVLWVLEDAEEKEWSSKSLVLQPCQRHLVEDIELIVKGTTQDGKVILAPFPMHSRFYILCYDLQCNDLTRVDIQGVPHHWFDKECYFDLTLMDENQRVVVYLET